jgi:hypothetical protein
VTPVTRGVADAQQHGLVLGARFREGLFAPRVPVDRIVGVLQEIRTRFINKMIRHTTDYTDNAD